MRQMGLSGNRRGRAWTVTTIGDERLERPADLVDRDFAAPAPNRLGRRYHLREDPLGVGVRRVRHRRVLPDGGRLAGVEVAALGPGARCAGDGDLEPQTSRDRRVGRGPPLRQGRPGRESGQYLSIRYADRLAANDIVASVGSKGDSFDNTMAESFNGLYKWELIYRQGPWRGLDDIEFATMTYVDWFNHRRLHGTITAGPSYTTPAAHEADYYRHSTPALEPVTQ